MNVKRAVRAAFTAALATIFVFGGLLFTVKVWASADLSYRSLDYDVQIQSDGSLTITQHIDMRLRKRTDDDDNVKPWKQLYQQYTLNGTNLSDITDISVRNVTTGQTYTQTAPRNPNGVSKTEWNSDYANHWYIADVTNGVYAPQPYEPIRDGYPIRSGAVDRSKTIEIGWNIPFTEHANSLQFDVTFTFVGATTLYDDVATFQWEPFGEANQTPIGSLTGTVHFPSGIDADNSWAWLHYAGTSSTSRGEDGSLKFTASDVRAKEYLDVVVAYDASVMKPPAWWSGGGATGGGTSADTGGGGGNAHSRNDANAVGSRSGDWIRHGTGSALDGVKASEAKQEAAWRDQQRSRARIRLAIWIGLALVVLILCTIALVSALRSHLGMRYRGDIEYWRDEPDVSPSSAAKFADVLDLKSRGSLSARQMSANVLSLASKKAIAIIPGPMSIYQGIDLSQLNATQLATMIGSSATDRQVAGTTSTIVLLPVCYDDRERENLHLSQSEAATLRLLKVISERVGGPVFDLERMNAVCKNWRDGYESLDQYETACDNEFAMLGATRTCGTLARVSGRCAVALAIATAVLHGIFYTITVALLIVAPALFVGLFSIQYAARTSLTDAGQRLAGQVRGLYRYMTDFSNFADRGAADLVLWDRYLVYAAAFGISDRVLRELAKAYPQVMDPDWLDSNASDSLLYWSYRPYAWYGGGTSGTSGMSDGGGFGDSGSGSDGFDPAAFSANAGDIGAQLNAGFADVRSTIQAAAPSSSNDSGGSFSGGGFGGSDGGSGGGSFGGR